MTASLFAVCVIPGCTTPVPGGGLRVQRRRCPRTAGCASIGATSGISDQKGRDMTAHLNLEQAVAIRDRLNAWIDEVPTRWGLKTSQPTREETPMSENMFQDFASPERVLDEYVMAMNRLGTISESLQARADALARIAELTPRTVDEAARSRFNRVWRELYTIPRPLLSEFQMLVDALGWTAAEPAKGCSACDEARCGDHDQAPTSAPETPAVEPDGCPNGVAPWECCADPICAVCNPKPPAVEMDSGRLRLLADTLDELDHQLGDSRRTTVLVLRIGGDL